MTSPLRLRTIPDQLFEARIKANELAESFLKQLVTLASTFFVLSIGFFWETIDRDAAPDHVWLLLMAWVALVASSCAAVLGIGILVNNLDLPDQSLTEREGFKGVARAYAAASLRVVIPCWIALLGFATGMVSFGVFATLQIFA